MGRPGPDRRKQLADLKARVNSVPGTYMFYFGGVWFLKAWVRLYGNSYQAAILGQGVGTELGAYKKAEALLVEHNALTPNP